MNAIIVEVYTQYRFHDHILYIETWERHTYGTLEANFMLFMIPA